MSLPDDKEPLISIVMPVYNNKEHLEKAIKSAVNQSYHKTEVVLYDDFSTQSDVRRILLVYNDHPRVRLFFSPINEGISIATNRAIARSTGKYVAFLDCDDMLPRHALETAAQYIKKYPNVHYFYSNREHINEEDQVFARYDFSKYSKENPYQEILKYMFPSHLKIIKKSCFQTVGLHKKMFDTCQDYDMALRLSEWFKFFFIPQYLYQYRIHNHQVSVTRKKEQANKAYGARNLAVVRRNIFFNKNIGSKKISIIMLTMNRLKRTAHSLQQLYKNTTLPFELIVVDNNSDPETRAFLEKLSREKSNLRIFYEPINLGCAGGRQKAIKYAEGDYIVTLDNDCEVTTYWVEKLLVRIVEEQNIGGACCKVVLPDGYIQYNGGNLSISNSFIRLSFMDERKKHSDLETFIERDCSWIPGGAAIFKRKVFAKARINQEIIGGFEDADFSLRVREAGYRLVNCPTSTVIHHHISQEPNSFKDHRYYKNRYDRRQILTAMVAFFKRNNLVIYDPWLFHYLQIPHASREETLSFFIQAADTPTLDIKGCLATNQ